MARTDPILQEHVAVSGSSRRRSVQPSALVDTIDSVLKGTAEAPSDIHHKRISPSKYAGHAELLVHHSYDARAASSSAPSELSYHPSDMAHIGQHSGEALVSDELLELGSHKKRVRPRYTQDFDIINGRELQHSTDGADARSRSRTGWDREAARRGSGGGDSTSKQYFPDGWRRGTRASANASVGGGVRPSYSHPAEAFERSNSRLGAPGAHGGERDHAWDHLRQQSQAPRGANAADTVRVEERNDLLNRMSPWTAALRH